MKTKLSQLLNAFLLQETKQDTIKTHDFFLSIACIINLINHFHYNELHFLSENNKFLYYINATYSKPNIIIFGK